MKNVKNYLIKKIFVTLGQLKHLLHERRLPPSFTKSHILFCTRCFTKEGENLKVIVLEIRARWEITYIDHLNFLAVFNS